MSQQNKTTLQSAINTQLADNTSGDISAADVRDNLINMTDSLLFNSGSQTFTGALTATSFIGSLEGTATTASYVENAISASYAATASTLLGSVTSASYAATSSITTFANTSNNVLHTNITSNDDYSITFTSVAGYGSTLCRIDQATGNSPFTYNPGASLLKITGSIITTGGITGSLQGTATTASYVAGANVDGTVALATLAVNSGRIYTNRTDTNGVYKVLFTDNINFDDNSDVYKENGSTFTYNPSTNILSVSYISATSITGSLSGSATTATSASYAATASVLLGSVTSASYAATSSLSQATIGAGVSGGEIQFRNGTDGKNTYSSFFNYNSANDGLGIGNPNTTGGYGSLYLAVGAEALANGNFSVAFGSASLASGDGSFTHGRYITASGIYSHAEGFGTQATNLGSHAEGFNTIASGLYAHAEGASQALGNWSHAEGSGCVALGDYSHAEGSQTIASGSGQHVSGIFNTQGDDTSLLIIGNGTGFNTRSDAFKVRMSGSIVLPTTASGTPSWTGTNGEMVPGDDGAGNYVLWVYLGGNWLTSSLGI